MSVGARIREARLFRGLNQEDTARAAGIAQPSLSELETGETKEISGKTLVGLAKALRVRTHWLMTGSGPMEPYANLTDDTTEEGRNLQTLLAGYTAAPEDVRKIMLSIAELQLEGKQSIGNNKS